MVNLSAQNAAIPVVIRDETGNVISAAGSTISPAVGIRMPTGDAHTYTLRCQRW